MNYQQQIEEGIDHLQAGRLEEASTLFDEVLARDPHHAEALHLRGMAAWQRDNNELALELIQRAIARDSSQAVFHDTLGLVYQSQQYLEAAEASFRRAIDLDPDQARWWNNLGNLQQNTGDLTGAAQSFAEAIRRDPDHAAAWYNLGNTLWGIEDLSGASDCFQKACVLSGSTGLPFRNLVSVLLQRGEMSQAVELLQTAVEDEPDNAELRCMLGGCLMSGGEPYEALPHLIHATKIEADSVTAWYGCGCARMETDQFASAAECFERVLELKPDQTESRHNLGRCLFELGQVDLAVTHFRLALRADSTMPLRTLASVLPGAPSAANQEIRDARRTWARQLGDPRLPADQFRNHSADPSRLLRVGYVIGDADTIDSLHPLVGLLQEHDPRQVEAHLFHEFPSDSAGSASSAESSAADSAAELEEEQDAWLLAINLPGEQQHSLQDLDNEAAAAAVRAAEIDVLIDLCGFARSRRLAMYLLRPAPVQLAWLGVNAPLGLPVFDGLIGDDWVLPPGEQRYYPEYIARVPGSCFAFTPDELAPPVQQPPCQEAGRLMFGSMAPLHHITPPVLDLWASILRSCPETGLLLKNSALTSRSNREFLYREFEVRGVGSDRLRLAGPADRHRSLKAWGQIDIALDTFPLSDPATLTAALWQGVPVLSFPGNRWASRIGTSLLRAAGLDEYLSADADALADQAIALAWNPETPDQLAELRSTLRERLAASPLCDVSGLAQGLEEEYRRLWQKWCRRQQLRFPPA